jgi:membrane protein required for beta-lactamase induction
LYIDDLILGLLLGFGVPWLILLSQPFIGPLFWGLAQGSAALLLTEILHLNHWHQNHNNNNNNNKDNIKRGIE